MKRLGYVVVAALALGATTAADAQDTVLQVGQFLPGIGKWLIVSQPEPVVDAGPTAEVTEVAPIPQVRTVRVASRAKVVVDLPEETVKVGAKVLLPRFRPDTFWFAGSFR